MHQLRHALLVATIALGSTAAFADGHAHAAPTTEAKATKPAKRGIPTKTPLPARAASTTKPSLAQLVALGRDEAPTAVEAPVAAEAPAEAAHAAVDAHAAPVDHGDAAPAEAAHAAVADHADHADNAEAQAAVPAFPTSTSSLPTGLTTSSPASTPSMPWGAVAFFVALIGGALAMWWKKQQGLKASGGPLLNVRETTAIGPRRQLLVVDVAGRRVLLSSSESGVAMLLDCGATPAADGNDDVTAGAGAERFFGDALAKAVRQERQEPTGGLQLVNTAGLPVTTSNALPAPPPMMPVVGSGPVRKNEAEATELMRRLGR